MFPGPGAIVYRNEAGEPLGWDNPIDDDPYDDYDDFDLDVGDFNDEFDDDDPFAGGDWDTEEVE